MKVIRTRNHELVFQLGNIERRLLLEMVNLYPVVPGSHHRLSKHSLTEAGIDENQHLLDQALAEQQKENRRQVRALLDEPGRFRQTKTGFELVLTAAQVEWLLQVLNDVRVGSWIVLGEPEPGEEPMVNDENEHFLLAMDVCGLFQSALLAALGIKESPQWTETD